MILILGGGLAGMSTAHHLRELPHLVLEAEPTPGGLCRSREIDGFVFDYTGHLLHLRDPRIVGLVDRLLPGSLETVARKARILTRGVSLPFPFQANLHGLPREVVADCLTGFVESSSVPAPTSPTTSFEDWSLAVFGAGISREFMFPYNGKLFRREPRELTADWVSWAVPKPSLHEVVRGALGIENEGMGYNPTFRYPRRGGIGVLPRALAGLVDRMRLGARVVEVDLDRRTARLQGGDTLDWERLVVSTPLPGFLRMLHGGGEDWKALAEPLDWTVVACVVLGVDRPAIADGAHWIYLPDADVPCYRVGFPSNFSDGVAPAGTSSMYVEFALRRDEPYEPERLQRSAVEALQKLGILEPNDVILVRGCMRIDPGYVIFDRARQGVMAAVAPALGQHGVHLVGRYGAWTYSYMERALLDGLQMAEMLRGSTPLEMLES